MLYTARFIGLDGIAVGVRRSLRYEGVGKLAALQVPQAELSRLYLETGGQPERMLAPVAEALRGQGYEAVLIIPAQARFVELVEEPSGKSEESMGLFVALKANEAVAVESAATLTSEGTLFASEVVRVVQTGGDAKALVGALNRFQSVLARANMRYGKTS